jgi:hypothetical protein
MIILMFTFLLLINLGYAEDHQANLLGDSKYGMSVKEVQKIFKEAIHEPNPNSISTTNSKSLLIIKEYKVETANTTAILEVEFFFNEDGLTSVHLTSKNPSLSQANSLSQLLIEKYGKPKDEDPKGQERDNSRSNYIIKWYENGTDISINCFGPFGDGSSIQLWLTYSSYTPKALNSL